MPSQTVYVPESAYQYADRTRDDDGESIGQRLSDLIERGIEAEKNE